MNCPICGAENRKTARFCRSCGFEFEKPAAAEAPSEAMQEVPDREPESEAEVTAAAAEEPTLAAQPVEELPAEPAAGAEAEEGLPAEPPAEPVEHKVEEEEAAEGPPLPWAEEGEEAPPLPDLDEELLAFWRDKAEPLTPVVSGTVVADRFVVVQVLEAGEDEILYLARDLRRCWQCGFEGNAPDEVFCAQCGVAVDRKPEVRLLETRAAEAEPSGGQGVAARLTDEGRFFLLLAETPEPAPVPPAVMPSVHLSFGRRSDPGQMRDLNEDSLLVLLMAPTYESRTRPMLGLFAVADGMGGHESGEVASKTALQVLAERMVHTVILPELTGHLVAEDEVPARLRQAILAANDSVYLLRHKAGSDMGTTLTVALIRDDRLFLAHVGDCRAYRWTAGGLEQLTTDHSVVASMIASGHAAPEEIYTHPHRNIIYRCIGDKPVVDVDTDVLPLTPGDRIILCSDGLWEMVHSEGIADVMMQEADPQVACDLLVQRANAAGGEDNISVIVIQVEERV